MRCRAVRFDGGALVDNGEYSRRFAAAWNRVRRRVRVGTAVDRRRRPRASAPATGNSIPHVWIGQPQVLGLGRARLAAMSTARDVRIKTHASAASLACCG